MLTISPARAALTGQIMVTAARPASVSLRPIRAICSYDLGGDLGGIRSSLLAPRSSLDDGTYRAVGRLRTL